MDEETASFPQQGRLEAASLPRVVRDLRRAEASGTLYLWNQEATKSLIFKRGDIVFAGTNVEKERLGERLVRAGKIKRSVLDLSFRVMERSHQRMGTTIVELGWISEMEMQRYVATQIKDIIYSVFNWHEGDYRFEPNDDPVAKDLCLELQTAEVIYEGACRVSDFAAIRAGVGSWKNRLKRAEGERLNIPITQEDGYILSQLNGASSIGDIIVTSPLGEEECLRRIYALTLAGVLEIEEPGVSNPQASKGKTESLESFSQDEQLFRDALAARRAAFEFADYYDRLGIDFGASGKKVREAYDGALAALEPSATFRHKLDDVKAQLEQVKRKIREAYEVLSVPESRRNYDRRFLAKGATSPTGAETLAHLTLRPNMAQPENDSKAIEEAELLFVEAKRLHHGGDYFDAVSALAKAVELDAKNGRYHCLLAQWLSQNPGCWESAQEHYERAIALDGNDVEAHLGLAALHEEAGRSERASQLYEIVASLSPRHA